jgi:hypothetical protein
MTFAEMHNLERRLDFLRRVKLSSSAAHAGPAVFSFGALRFTGEQLKDCVTPPGIVEKLLATRLSIEESVP